MFDLRPLDDELAAVRDAHAPDTLVLDADSDFETIPPAAAESLGLFAEELDPASYPSEWLPDDAPSPLVAYAGPDFTVGMPGDGTVTWTRQTTPPTVVVKQRAAGTPEGFRRFLLAEAFVQIGTDAPEQFLPFFGATYRELDSVVPLGPGEVYQIAAALYDAWLGLQTRESFLAWADTHPDLFDAWADAGSRLEGRLSTLPRAVARGGTSFPEATEYACAAVKHDLELPAPFAALDTHAFVEYGPDYGVQWAEKTFEKLEAGRDGAPGSGNDGAAGSDDDGGSSGDDAASPGPDDA
jgi:hypothetical protein